MNDPDLRQDLSGMHVLVVEDEALLADVMADELEAFGIVPLGPCPSVASAMEAIRDSARLDGALLNVQLRGELLFPIADELRLRGIPFVFVTGNDPTVTQGYPDAPVHSKPAEIADVLASLAALIRERRERSAASPARATVSQNYSFDWNY
ncbi:response regulator [Lichenibacterium minor]|uniref:Response regulator n=1 Tax=Lichenibacterium minor TaxID=2316528 RepID=A0A4Q2TXQ0_9HYPH|nr:response regulator [Lichenibacterium minor]RYC28853.1 response regulator [Lichenibacterium minor]